MARRSSPGPLPRHRTPTAKARKPGVILRAHLPQPHPLLLPFLLPRPGPSLPAHCLEWCSGAFTCLHRTPQDGVEGCFFPLPSHLSLSSNSKPRCGSLATPFPHTRCSSPGHPPSAFPCSELPTHSSGAPPLASLSFSRLPFPWIPGPTCPALGLPRKGGLYPQALCLSHLLFNMSVGTEATRSTDES